jgi:hypothetical protein
MYLIEHTQRVLMFTKVGQLLLNFTILSPVSLIQR